jgi:hypothetical protein
MTRRNQTTGLLNKRRTSHSRKTLSTKRKTQGSVDLAKHRMPPVMVRNSYQAISGANRKNKPKRIKRRYDIPVSNPQTPGVEIRLPSIPEFRIGWRFLSLVLMSSLFILLNYLWNSPLFQISQVDVTGALRITPNEIINVLDVLGKSVFLSDPKQMEAILAKSFPELTDISVMVEFPAQVMVEVIERVPMILWTYNEESYWIDGNGYVYKPQGDADNLVVVISDVPPPFEISRQLELKEDDNHGIISHELVSAIFKIKTQAPEEADIIFESHHGLGWRNKKSWDVYFGTDVTQIESKFLVYRGVVEKLNSDGIKPTLITVEYLDSPYYRMEQ